MYNRELPYYSKALNYFYIFIGAISAIYFVASFFMSNNQAAPDMLLMQRYNRYFMMLCIVIDILLAIYVRVSQLKPVLFLQSLSAMLLFAAHIFFVYGCFVFTNGIISSASAVDFGLILLVFSCLLHLSNLWKPKTIEKIKPINVSDSIFDDFEEESTWED